MRSARLCAAAAALVMVGMAAAPLAASAAPAPAAAPCPDGNTRVNLVDVKVQADLSCGDLHGFDLSGRSLVQVTLDHADLEGANLTDAELDQASLVGADLRGANLTDADLTQADLTDADLTGADLTGANISQATLDGTTFDQVKGVRPYSLYVTALGVVVLAGMAMQTFTKASRRRRANLEAAPNRAGTPVPSQVPGSKSPAQSPFGTLALASSRKGAGRTLVVGLLGALATALGLQAFIGGLLSVLGPAFDPLARVCQQATCQANIDLGINGVFAGLFLALLGLTVWGSS